MNNASNALAIFNMSSGGFLTEYIPIVLFIVIGFSMVFGILIASYIIAPKNPYKDKNISYESGMDPFMSAHKFINIRFYLVAVLFVLFDVEIVLLYPFSLVFKEINIYSFSSMVIFFVLFIIGFLYEYKKGVLDWY